VAEHPVELLFQSIQDVEPFPEGVVALPARFSGTGFFPGGAGLWGAEANKALPPMPVEGIMVLGHDFHSETEFAKTLVHGAEIETSERASNYRRIPTWTALLALLTEVGVPPQRCFFTNVYMGLRRGSGSTGRFPGAKDRDFVVRCQSFFEKQIAAQRPRVILTLGVWVPVFLAPVANELHDWRGAPSYADLDRLGPVRHGVKLAGSSIPCSVVALTHPSLRGPNVHRRRFKGLSGHSAEVAMIREALDRTHYDRGGYDRSSP
jgi:hypothetical protein